MTFHALIPLIAAVTTFALGILIYVRGPRSPVRGAFTRLACVLVFWNLHSFILYSVADAELAMRISRVFRIGSMFLPAAILDLCLASVKMRSPRWLTLLVVDYALGGFLACATWYDLVVQGLAESSWGHYSVAGPLYNLFTLLLVGNCLAGLAIEVAEYRKSTDSTTRLQLRFWLLGAAVAIPLGFLNLLPVYGMPFIPVGHLGNALWAAIIAYAIVRHRLMDIQLVVTKGMAYAAVSLVLIIPLFFVALWLQRLSFGSIHPDFSFAILVMLVGVAVLFPFLRTRIEPRIERSLIRERREYRATIVEFTRTIVRILERERLIEEVASTLKNCLGLDRIAVFVADEHSTFRLAHSLGVAPIVDDFPDRTLRAVLSRGKAVMRAELSAGGSDTTDTAVLKSVFEPNGWEVCIPLVGSGQSVGFIALGCKPNLAAFYAEDLELLETLAAEASVALENARLYEELRRSQDIIRRADRSSALGTLAAGIAHEIRNPLVSIQTFFQLAPQRLQDEEFMTEFLGMTANEVKRISRLINELLSFARSPTPTYGPVDLNHLVDRVALLISPEARKQRIDLKQDLAPDVPHVNGDPEQIRQVLVNLAFNAIQATQPGGSVTVSTHQWHRHGAGFGRLSVSDTGCGIPYDQLENIFNPFYTTKVKGTGLGLAIAQRIVSEHGGLLSVESVVGQGTRFFVDLPEVPFDGDDLGSAKGQENGAGKR
jgi:signal transduction histidine kinase